ncbi:MAG: hypothetical protein J6P93_02495 [Alphaproteobacteria bacterium]|nr:hypothetical protein [Alphaproteobacteria bacterium]
MIKNIAVTALLCAVLCACISAEERAAAKNRMNSVLNRQCSVTMGFKLGTEEYMQCRMFYDDVLRYRNMDMDYLSFDKVDSFRLKMDDLNKTCTQYLGNFNPPPGAIWNCVRKKEQDVIDEAIRKRDLKDEEDMRRRSMADAMKEANADARLQDRIDAERERVAAETGKRPSKVKCKTYDKGNGYVQVKCK